MYGSGEPDTIGVVCFLIVVIPDRKKKKRKTGKKFEYFFTSPVRCYLKTRLTYII